MRSNSGKDESRNNLKDPTLRDRDIDRDGIQITPSDSDAKAPADRREGRKD